MSNDDFAESPWLIPNHIIVYQLKIDDKPVISVQIDTKKQIMIQRCIGKKKDAD